MVSAKSNNRNIESSTIKPNGRKCNHSKSNDIKLDKSKLNNIQLDGLQTI